MAELQIGFALHQEKRGKEFREKIIAPVGHTVVEFDAAGQEFRWMAEESGDEVMKQLCMPGEDAHSYMGSRIDPKWDYRDLIKAVKDGNKEAIHLRLNGKVGNLSLQYRTSASRFCSSARVDYNVDMTLRQAAHIHGVYPKTYKGMPLYWENQIEKTKRLGYVENLAGRRVAVKGDWSRYSKMRWSMESTAINFPIQAVGADQKYLALACVKNIISEFDTKFFMDLHDGLYWLTPDAKVQPFIIRTKKILDGLPYTRAWGYTPSIPLPWDASFGPSWGTLKSWKG